MSVLGLFARCTLIGTLARFGTLRHAGARRFTCARCICDVGTTFSASSRVPASMPIPETSRLSRVSPSESLNSKSECKQFVVKISTRTCQKWNELAAAKFQSCVCG